MCTTKSKRKSVLLKGSWITILLILSADTLFATSMTPRMAPNTNQMVFQKIMEELNAQEIIAIDKINQRYNEQRIALQQALLNVQNTFNRHLSLAVEEQEIREAFEPVAQVMEDLAVNDILMMREINAILLTHLEKSNHQPAELALDGAVH